MMQELALLKETGAWGGKKHTEEIIVDKKRTLTPADGESILLIVPENCEVTITERGSGTFTIDLIAHENAQITYRAFTTNSKATRLAHLSTNARILWAELALDGGASTITTYLAGKGSDARLRSVFLGKSNDHSTISSTMIHAGDKSTSNMLTRSVMLDESSGDYKGLIRIKDDAKGCDAYQKEDTLLLSAKARMHAMPNLEIGNEDVKCSHGVSLGKIDREKLFYLRSRGIAEREAIRLIVDGFFADIVDEFGEHSTEAMGQITKRLEGEHHVA